MPRFWLLVFGVPSDVSLKILDDIGNRNVPTDDKELELYHDALGHLVRITRQKVLATH